MPPRLAHGPGCQRHALFSTHSAGPLCLIPRSNAFQDTQHVVLPIVTLPGVSRDDGL